eukprot:gene16962-35178_t
MVAYSVHGCLGRWRSRPVACVHRAGGALRPSIALGQRRAASACLIQQSGMWIDTHCHLDAAEFDADRDAVREAARLAGVARCVIPAVQRVHWADV